MREGRRERSLSLSQRQCFFISPCAHAHANCLLGLSVIYRLCLIFRNRKQILLSVRQSQHTVEIKQIKEALLGKQFELAIQLWASATAGQIYEPVYDETIRILDRIHAIETLFLPCVGMYISFCYNTRKHTVTRCLKSHPFTQGSQDVIYIVPWSCVLSLGCC